MFPQENKMERFTLKLAEIPIQVDATYESTKQYCEAYLTDDAPVISACVTQADIDCERVVSEREEQIENLPHYEYSDAYLEQLAVYRKIAESLLEYNVLLFHGAAFSADGMGILLAASSGTGKTTHMRLWQRMMAERGEKLTVINGDKPLLRVFDEEVRMYGTPWRGKEGYGENTSAKLDSIVLLSRGTKNEIQEITPQQALPRVLQQVYRPKSIHTMQKTMQLLDAVTRRVRFYSLQCNMELNAAETAYKGMLS